MCYKIYVDFTISVTYGMERFHWLSLAGYLIGHRLHAYANKDFINQEMGTLAQW